MSGEIVKFSCDWDSVELSQRRRSSASEEWLDSLSDDIGGKLIVHVCRLKKVRMDSKHNLRWVIRVSVPTVEANDVARVLFSLVDWVVP